MKKYTFEEVLNCEMCESPTSGHKILGQRLNKSQGFKPKKKEGITVTVKKCTRCNLAYSSPQPIPNDIQDHYGVPPEEYWSQNKDYFKWTPEYFSRQTETAKKLVNFHPGMKALDIGAGLGKAMITMEKAGFDAYGMEPSKPFYEKAISHMGMNPEKLKLGMVEDIDYPANEFDFITYGVVMEHLYHPAAVLERSLKWLKPGGIIHVEVPSSSYLFSKILNLYYNLIGTNYVTNISPMHPPFHLYEFHLKSFEALAKRLGVEVIEHRYWSSNVPQFTPIVYKPLKWIMDRTETGMQLDVWMKK